MGKKRTFSTRIDDDRLKALKHLAVDTEKSLGALLEEAIEDLIHKYEKKKKWKEAANHGKAVLWIMLPWEEPAIKQ